MTPDCPPRDDLLAMLNLPEGHPTVVEAETHVANCPDCQNHLLSQVTWDGFTSSPDQLDPELMSLRAEPGCQRALLEMSALSYQPAAGPELTAALSKSSDSVADGLPGELGEYRILQVIAAGGMGLVLHGRNAAGADVAIKIVRPAVKHNPQLLDRFRLEIGLMRGLTHPHLVRAVDHGEHEGRPYLVMERLDGLDLSAICRRLGRLTVPDACELVRQAATVIDHLHRQGVIHRDIKPSNLMLARETEGVCRVKLLDLGLARLIEGPRGQGLTVTGQVLGTYDFMAPEQAVSSRRVDGRADVYSLGATLWKLLSGSTLGAAHPRADLAGDCPAPSHLPRALTRLVAKLTDYDPASRPATLGEVVALLGPWCRGADPRGVLDRAQAARDEPFAEPARDSTVSSGLTGADAPPRPRATLVSPTRRRWLLGMVGLGGAAVVGLSFRSARPPADNVPPAQAADGQPGTVFQSRIPEARLTLRGPAETFEFSPGSDRVITPGKYAVSLVVRDAIHECGVLLIPSVTPPAAANPGNHPTFRLEPTESTWELFVEDELWAVGPLGDQDRAVLDWVCDHTAGSVTVALDSQTNLLFDRKSSQPRPGLPRVREIELIPAEPHPTATYIDLLARASSLETLTLQHIPLDAPAVARLACAGALRTTTKLQLISTGLMSGDCAPLVRLERLQKLDLIGESRIDDDLPRVVAAWPALWYLHCLGSVMTGEHLGELGGLGLRHLGIGWCGLTPAGLRAIARLETLEELAISGTPIDDGALNGLEALPRLSRLEIANTAVTDEGLELIGRLGSLTQLDVSYLPITAAGLHHLRTLTLKSLIMASTKIDAAALLAIRPEELTHLVLQSCPVGDDIVDALLRFPRLKVLDVGKTAISPVGINRLREALPDCELVGLSAAN